MFSQHFNDRLLKNENANLIQTLRTNFDALFKLDYESFIKEIQKMIPESLLLKEKANTSAEGIAADKAKKNVFGLTEDEEIRAFSGLLRFKDVINAREEDYKNFVACQIEMKKPVLSFASFQKMHDYVIQTLLTPEDYAAAMWSILCNDLGKVHSVIEAYEALDNKKKIGHDGLLAELLKQKPQLFPAFAALPQYLQTSIIEGYACGCDLSMLEQLELPVTSINALKNLDKKALELYSLHTIFDVSGAAAHFKSNGSLTMHEETWSFFNALSQSLQLLNNEKNHTIQDVYQDYLQYRGQRIGIQPNSPVNIALVRIAGLTRLGTCEQGNMLMSVWSSLPAHTKETLTRELTVHGDEGLRAIFIGYGVAMLLNSQGALQKELTEFSKALNIVVTAEQRGLANQEGLKIGLITMANVFDQTRKIIGNDPSSEIFVAECDEIARFLSKEPRKALEMDLSISSSCERRLDFNMVTKSSTSKQDNNSTLSFAGKTNHSAQLFNQQVQTRPNITSVTENKPKL